jgi:DHA2 family multidrug resistance protein
VQRYNAEQIGEVLAWTGLPQLILIPLVPKLMQRIDARYLAAFGLLLFAYSSFMNTTMSLDYSGDQFWIPNIVRAVGQALTLAPLSNVSLGGIAPQDAPAASGISNMLRNLGGAIGTAVLATIVTKREQFHSNIIGQSIDLNREEVRSRIATVTDYFMARGVTDPTAAHQQAIIALGNTVKRQALVMGFSDTFAVLGFVLLISAIAILLTRKVKAAASGGGRIEATVRGPERGCLTSPRKSPSIRHKRARGQGIWGSPESLSRTCVAADCVLGWNRIRIRGLVSDDLKTGRPR